MTAERLVACIRLDEGCSRSSFLSFFSLLSEEDDEDESFFLSSSEAKTEMAFSTSSGLLDLSDIRVSLVSPTTACLREEACGSGYYEQSVLLYV